jgi:hypothetical protein
MRFRATWASFLTAMLLFISSAASNCEIKCELTSSGPSCHAAAHTGRAQHEQMPAMSGMQHDSATGSSGSSTAMFFLHSAACQAHACAQQPAVLDEQRAAVSHVSRSVPAVSHDPSRFAPEPTLAGFAVRGPPSFRPATPVSGGTTLLV